MGVAGAGPDTNHAGAHHPGRLYAHPEHRGEGVGTRLLDELRERLRAGGERLRLVVLAENPVGVPFYESYGFERVGSREGETDGVAHEGYVHELSLAPQD